MAQLVNPDMGGVNPDEIGYVHSALARLGFSETTSDHARRHEFVRSVDGLRISVTLFPHGEHAQHYTVYDAQGQILLNTAYFGPLEKHLETEFKVQ